MALFETIQPLFVLSGFAVGFLVGMTGVGGGSLMTPLLILLFHVHPVTAVGTDLIYASVTKNGGSVVHGLGKTIDWRVVRRLALGSLPASLLTMTVLWALKIDQASYSALVTKILGVALICTSLALLCGCASEPRPPSGSTMPHRDINTVLRAHDRELLAIPGVVGVYVGLLPDRKTPCLRVMAVKKTKGLEQAIPKSLEGYRVELEETGVIRPMQHTP